MKVIQTFNIPHIDELVSTGLITKRKHPIYDIWILNYTSKVQFEKLWTDELLMFRGLVIDNVGDIIARPFKKFFNYDEYPNLILRNEAFEITKKIDGSLIILFNYKDNWITTTKGSFESDQSIWAQDLLLKYNLEKLNPEITYLFELVHPENRIVCDYKDQKDLIFLAAFNTKLDIEISRNQIKNIGIFDMKCPIVQTVNYTSISELFEMMKKYNQNDEEGFVIHGLESNYRIKIKYPYYLNLHRLISYLTPKHIWESFYNNTVDEYINMLPDEFYKSYREISDELIIKFQEIKIFIMKEYESIPKSKISNRKELAEIVKTKTYPHILFALIDNNPNLDKLIWNQIKPNKPE